MSTARNGSDPSDHPINWFDSTRRSIEGHFSFKRDGEHSEVERRDFSAIRQASDSITERLSALFLDRLPNDLGRQFLHLLPLSKQQQLTHLYRNTESQEDSSIGFPTFVERAELAVGAKISEDHAHQVAETFLWAVIQEIPADLKKRLSEVLPLELRSRMNLYSAHGDASQVA